MDDGNTYATSASISFTPANARSPQYVRLRAVDDDVLEGDHVAAIALTSSSTDSHYDAVAIPHIGVAILDNETLNVQSVVVGDGTAQRSKITGLVVTFTEQVVIGEGAFAVTQRGTRNEVDVAYTTELVERKTVAALTFSGALTEYGSLADGDYQLTIDSLKVTCNGLHLDGDEDAIVGGDYVFGEEEVDNFFRFFGDAVGQNRWVNLPDFAAFRFTYGTRFGDDRYRAELDYDGNGIVNLSDFANFRARYGKQLIFEE